MCVAGAEDKGRARWGTCAVATCARKEDARFKVLWGQAASDCSAQAQSQALTVAGRGAMQWYGSGCVRLSCAGR